MGLPSSKYKEYINSPKWVFKRAEFLKSNLVQKASDVNNRIIYKCGICQRFTRFAEVHHITYQNLGEELLSDLMCLCTVCHHKVHELGFEQAKNRPIPNLYSLSTYWDEKKAFLQKQKFTVYPKIALFEDKITNKHMKHRKFKSKNKK